MTLTRRAQLLLGLAAVALIAGFLPWAGNGLFEDSGQGSTSALKVTTQILWDTTPASLHGTPLIIPLVILVAATVAGVFVRGARWLTIAGAAGLVALGLLYLNGLRALYADDMYNLPGSTFGSFGIGAWLATLAGAAALVVAIRSDIDSAAPADD